MMREREGGIISRRLKYEATAGPALLTLAAACLISQAVPPTLYLLAAILAAATMAVMRHAPVAVRIRQDR
jgi:hypothetical protein